MDRDSLEITVYCGGEDVGGIDKIHRYGDRHAEITRYEANHWAGDGACRTFKVEEYGTPRKTLAAAKAWVRSSVPLSLAEEADES